MPVRQLPALPKQAHTKDGYVDVVFTEDETILGEGVFGAWDNHLRVIYVRRGLHPTAQWLTFFHEQTHANLDDVDVALSTEVLEILCNTIAAARVRELLDSLEAKPRPKRRKG